MPQLNVTLVSGPDQVVVRFSGDADLSTSSLITAALTHAARHRTRQIVVDVAAVRFWDCSGLHELAGFTAELASGGRACRIVGAPPATRRLIRAAALSDRLELDGPVEPDVVSPDATGALSAVAQRGADTRNPDPVVPAGASRD